MIRLSGDHLGYFALPCLGEVVCGDDCFIRWEPDRMTVALIDGSGHGPAAREVADLARAALSQLSPSETPEKSIQTLHHRLRGTPGAAVVLATLSLEGDRWVGSYEAVGDVRVLVAGEKIGWMPARDGVVGHAMHTYRPSLPLEVKRGERLVLLSDGVKPTVVESLNLDRMMGTPVDIARRLVFEHKLDYDDSSCLVFFAP